MKIGIYRTTLALAAASLVIALSACGSALPGSSSGPSVSSAALTTLKVGTIGIGSDAAIKIAIDNGFFKEQGLDVKTSVVANPPAGIAAAQSGQLDLAYTPSIPLVNALANGVPLTVVAAADGYSERDLAKDASSIDGTGLLVAKDSPIQRPKDLEGKSVSVPARKAQLEITVSKLIKDDGGDPSTVNWMVLDPSSALQSLNSGRVDAASLVAPFVSKAISQGDRLLASPGVAFFKAGAVGLWITGNTTLAKDRKAIEGFRTAIYKANAYANSHRDEAEQASSQLTNLPLDVIKASAPNYWPDTVKIADIQRVNDSMASLGYLKEPVKIPADLILGNS